MPLALADLFILLPLPLALSLLRLAVSSCGRAGGCVILASQSVALAFVISCRPLADAVRTSTPEWTSTVKNMMDHSLPPKGRTSWQLLPLRHTHSDDASNISASLPVTDETLTLTIRRPFAQYLISPPSRPGLGALETRMRRHRAHLYDAHKEKSHPLTLVLFFLIPRSTAAFLACAFVSPPPSVFALHCSPRAFLPFRTVLGQMFAPQASLNKCKH